jgi:hypothetical protein
MNIGGVSSAIVTEFKLEVNGAGHAASTNSARVYNIRTLSFVYSGGWAMWRAWS